MHSSKRHSIIENQANLYGFAAIDRLAELCGVSAQTIRRDIKDLAEAGRVARLHGGAGPSSTSKIPAIEERRGKNATAKNSMGKLAAERIPDYARLFIGAGSTMEALSEHLAGKQGLVVFTINIQVALIMHHYPGIQLILPHGNLNPDLHSLTGSDVVESIRRYSMDYCLITTGGIHDDGDFYDLSDPIAPAIIAMRERSRQVILAADSSKFAPLGCRKTGNLADVHTLVTEKRPGQPVLDLLQRSGTELICG